MGSAAKKRQISSVFQEYCNQINSKRKFKDAREHAYRPALQAFIEGQNSKIEAINDAARISCGAPDFIVYEKRVPIGYVEAKDIGKNLNKEEKTKQIESYHSLGNLILTDYVEFRWYVDGKLRKTVKIGTAKAKVIEIDEAAEEQLTDLFQQFMQLEAKTIKTANELSQRLALSTKSIRDLIVRSFDMEDDTTGWLHRWMRAFSEVLIKDLDKNKFADMFAQTLTYGLFAARVHHSSGAEFSRFSAAKILPKTNPFLRKLFAQFAGVDMPDTLNWAIDEIISLLKRIDLEKILSDFGKGIHKKDPIVHFYETFLAEYDPKLRSSRGVYYTPNPIVDFIVKSVESILVREFNVDKGLADPNTLILDPATGTGSFLHAVVERIHNRFLDDEGAWDSYVSSSVLGRIFGFEILMAPYSMAHLKLGLQLQETGYKFEKNERLGVYLTNTLEAAAKKSQELFFEWVSDEANAAAEIKKERPIMVVLGNPPYSGHSANKGKWISQLLKGHDSITGKTTDNYFECDGQPLGEKNPKWLNDDYVKFIRFAQWRLKETGHGVLGFVTNHGFLDNPTFRGMRQSLIKSFDSIYLLDLHGNVKKKEVCPDGSKDENVFDIQQGVSICFLVRQNGDHERNAKIFRSDLWGDRDYKYEWLFSNTIDTVKWQNVEATKPFYLFSADQNKDLQVEFQNYSKLTELFPINALGFQTHRDKFAVAYTEKELEERLVDLRDNQKSDEELKQKYKLKDNRDWQLSGSREKIQGQRVWRKPITNCLYRPYDERVCYLDYIAMDYPRRELLDNVLNKDNICLLASRQQATEGFRHAWITKLPPESCAISTKTKEQNYFFPLFRYPDSPLENRGEKKLIREPNIDPKVLRALEVQYGVTFFDGSSTKVNLSFEEIAYYSYAIMNSTSYRERYGELLKTDFPRIPFAKSKDLFVKLAKMGRQLAEVHTMERTSEDKSIKFPIKGENEISKVKYDSENERLYINKTQYLEGISGYLWDYKVGGYELVLKWIKNRKDKTLTYDDISQLRKISWCCKKSDSITEEIDSALSAAWPMEAIAIDESLAIQKPRPKQVKQRKKSRFQQTLDNRLVLASKIILEQSDSEAFGRVKFAKVFYLADMVSEIDLQTEYTREAAGPLDQRLLYNEKYGIESVGANRDIFTTKEITRGKSKMAKYLPSKNLQNEADKLDSIFGESVAEVERIIDLTRPMTTDQAEIFATLYACWNDLLIGKKKITADALILEFKDKWHPEKSKKFKKSNSKSPRFTVNQIKRAIKWMKKMNVVPRGKGKPTQHKRVTSEDIPF